MNPTKLHTPTITNMQIFVAVFAAFLAGGLAFVTLPGRTDDTIKAETHVCGVAAVNFGSTCAREKLRGGSFVCDNGVEIAFGEQCRSLESLVRVAKEECGKLSCERFQDKAFSNVASTASPISQPDIATVNVTIKNSVEE